MDLSNYTYFGVLGFVLFFWLFPLIIIMSSKRTSGKEKLAWILAVVFISWFAWIFYFLLAPITKNTSRSH